MRVLNENMANLATVADIQLRILLTPTSPRTVVHERIPVTNEPSTAVTSPALPGEAKLSARFLGVGNAGNRALGSAALVIERDGEPLLLIDCGPDTLDEYLAAYDRLPDALFITHTHLDHVGGLENLFYRACFANGGRRSDIRLFVPSAIVAHLHQRIADYPNNLAEGGVNFWDVLRLVPVLSHFWLHGLRLRPWAVRHHAPDSAFGLHLPGSFFYSGDTRPLPELLGTVAAQGETLFHDCGLRGNPSHSGLDDILRDYPPAVRERIVAYHYAADDDAQAITAAGLRAARRGERLPLPSPRCA
jgi:glyoxylase-like metal-dependent hydrolase (beta-lactamase superfamily II)